MKHFICLITILFLGLKSLCLAVPVTEEELTHIQVHQHQEHILYENYLQTDDGLASVFGYHFDTYLSDRTSFVLAIFGAVSGNRGGSGIAAFGLAYLHPLGSQLNWDTRILAGSGGGGGLDAGGGLMWEVQTGPSYEIMDNIYIDFKYGYLNFTSGSFETPIVNFGVSFKHSSLTLPEG